MWSGGKHEECVSGGPGPFLFRCTGEKATCDQCGPLQGEAGAVTQHGDKSTLSFRGSLRTDLVSLTVFLPGFCTPACLCLSSFLFSPGPPGEATWQSHIQGHPFPDWLPGGFNFGPLSLLSSRISYILFKGCVSSGRHDYQRLWLKQQTFISYCSGGWEGQGQGTCWFISQGGLSSWLGEDTFILVMSSRGGSGWGRERVGTHKLALWHLFL